MRAFFNFFSLAFRGFMFCFHQEKFAFIRRSVLKWPKCFPHISRHEVFFRAMTTFFDLKCCFLFLWPTNCSNLMCMKWHNFWCIIGSARAKSLGGAYMPLPAWNKLYLSPRGIGLMVPSNFVLAIGECCGWILSWLIGEEDDFKIEVFKN